MYLCFKFVVEVNISRYTLNLFLFTGGFQYGQSLYSYSRRELQPPRDKQHSGLSHRAEVDTKPTLPHIEGGKERVDLS